MSDTTHDELVVTIHDDVAWITLNRAEKRNALHRKLIAAWLIVLKKLAEDQQIRALVIRGEGEHFCAGADIVGMQKMAMSSRQENQEDAELFADLLYQLYIFPKPTLILAHGTTLGGGLGLLAACDMAMAADNALFCFSEVKIGLIPAMISPYVISAIGSRAAQYYFMTGEVFTADTALHMGLLHRTVAADRLYKETEQLLQMIKQNGPNALIEIKRLVQQIKDMPLTVELTKQTAAHLARLRTSNEAQEGLRAFVEKRKPEWSKSSR